MQPDDLQQAWQSQKPAARMTIDVELLVKELRRSQQLFSATLFRGDIREIVISLFLVPLWLYLGYRLRLPWTWYLIVPVLLWLVGWMLADCIRHKRQPPEPGESLRKRVEASLAQVDHQIWLLRNVFWWCLLPMSIPMLAFLGQVCWYRRKGGWATVYSFALMVAIVSCVFGLVYRVNQAAVRNPLLPRREELETLHRSLDDEA